eukprot:4348542-Pyramimonas_sp.AAC.1
MAVLGGSGRLWTPSERHLGAIRRFWVMLGAIERYWALFRALRADIHLIQDLKIYNLRLHLMRRYTLNCFRDSRSNL